MSDDIKKAMELAKLDPFSAQARQTAELMRVSQPAVDIFSRQAAEYQKMLRAVQGPLADANLLGAIETARANHLAIDTEHQRRLLDAIAGPSTQLAKFAMPDASVTAAARYALDQERLRGLLGPLNELRASGILDQLSISSTAASTMKTALSCYESNFVRPNADAIAAIAKQYAVYTAFAKDIDIAGVTAQMRSSWLDTQNSVRSLASLVEVQGIGRALARVGPFDDALACGLRANLGDWRDAMTWPDTVRGNLSARSTFYAERGFRVELTDFPPAAFDEAMEIAGLQGEPPSLVDQYGEPLPLIDGTEESDFVRTNTAYSWLLRFETHMRRFIDALLTEAFGPDWPRHRLPNGLYDEWLRKQRTAIERGGVGRPLICYADFTDYERIVLKRDLWPVFEPFFRRQESVRESLQRLYLPRLETMHARPISQEDELLLYVEVKRLGKVFQ